MNKNPESKNQEAIDCFLDITADTCPITYVKTKLKLETMTEGEILEVRLIGAEPLENVPRTASANGHTVLNIE
ncbi:MAG: sulfurtransferase TusA family protein, partial [Alphaproteobacteria bacterium]